MMNLVHDESSAKATDQKLLFYSCIVLRSSANRHRSWIQIHLRCTIMSSESGYDVETDLISSVSMYSKCFKKTKQTIYNETEM